MKAKIDEMHKVITGYPDQALQAIPALADNKTLTQGAAWVYGVVTEILSAVLNTTRLRIIAVHVSNPSAAGEFLIRLQRGSDIIGYIPVTFENVAGAGVTIPLPHPIFVEPGAAINGYVAGTTGALTVEVKLLAAAV